MTKTIPGSELILNPDGSVYHLALREDEIADTIILVGDPERVGQVSRYFDRIVVKKQHREFVTHTGYIGQKHLSVVSTGIGTDNVDIVITELDALVNIDLKTRQEHEKNKSLTLIRLGTAGGLQANLPVGSIVRTTLAIGFDGLMHFYSTHQTPEEEALKKAFLRHFNLNDINTSPYTSSVSYSLLSQFKQNNYVDGFTVTCGGFYGAQGRGLRIESKLSDFLKDLASFNYLDGKILNFEMETAGIYGLGKALGHRCLSLSLIILNRVTKDLERDIPGSMDRLIKEALDHIIAL